MIAYILYIKVDRNISSVYTVGNNHITVFVNNYKQYTDWTCLKLKTVGFERDKKLKEIIKW